MGLVVDSYRFAAAGGAFDPIADVGWAHAYWAEGTEFVALGVADGGAVTSWPDEVGTSNLATGVSAVYLASGIGGMPSMRPQASGSRLQITFTPIAIPWTIVLVSTFPSGMGNYKYLIDGGSYEQAIIYEEGSGPRVLGLSAGGMTHGTHLWTYKNDGASSVVEEDGTVVRSGTSTSNSLSGFTVFGGYNDARNYVGDPSRIAFAGIYSGDARADGSWADFEQWVEDHYGILIT